MKKPMIGLTASFLTEKRQWMLYDDYAQAILSAGGVPVVIPLTGDREILAPFVQICDGFLFSGGPDLDPANYGEPLHPAAGVPNVRRDENEIALFALVRETKKPLFGICRGIQTLNVFFGGDLYQDVPSQIGKDCAHRSDAPEGASHRVSVLPDTRLSRLLGETEITVNSFHHQGVRRVAEGLRASAVAPDGLIEAVESEEDAPFVMAVQWHPERTVTEANSKRLFECFVGACAEFAKNSKLLD